MPELDFTDQSGRLRAIVGNALDGATYVASHREEGGSHLVIEGRRPDGRGVSVRFRAVKDSEATAEPAAGSVMKLNSVRAGGGGCLIPLWLFSRSFPRIPPGSSRVRIDAGDVRLDIFCEDAEWWEEETPPTGA